MYFKDFDKDIAKEFGISIKTARKILGLVNEKMTNKIMFGHPVRFKDLGTLYLKVRLPRKFRNLQTGEIQKNKKAYYLGVKVPVKMRQRLKHKIIFDEDTIRG